MIDGSDSSLAPVRTRDSLATFWRPLIGGDILYDLKNKSKREIFEAMHWIPIKRTCEDEGKKEINRVRFGL